MRSLLSLFAVTFAGCAVAGIGIAAPSNGTHGSRTWSANLTTSQEVPRPRGAAGATGAFKATGSFECPEGASGCDTRAGRMRWRLSFRNLTGPALAAHVHLAPKGKAGPVVIALCAPCKANAKGVVSVSRRVFEAVTKRRGYVNVHTAKNPTGEIRGQLDAAAVL